MDSVFRSAQTEPVQEPVVQAKNDPASVKTEIEVPYLDNIDGTRNHPFYPGLVESIFGTKEKWKPFCYWKIKW